MNVPETPGAGDAGAPGTDPGIAAEPAGLEAQDAVDLVELEAMEAALHAEHGLF